MALASRNAVVFGVANKNSLAWAVANSWNRAGAQVALCIQSDRFRQKVEKLTENWDRPPLVLTCDVENQSEVQQVCGTVADHFGSIDACLHSIAYAPPDAAKAASLMDIPKESFLRTVDVSAYSLIEITKGISPHMHNGGSIVSMTYDATSRVVPGYGFMAPSKASLETISKYLAAELGPRNIRVNCISAGPVNTLAARGIPNFRSMLESSREGASLKRNVTTQEVADTATFLVSSMASGITGQVIKVDCGE